MTVARELASWSTQVRSAHLPAAVRRATCRHLLDGIGVALGAARTGDANPAVNVARGLGGPPEARCLAGGEPLGAPAAALADGVLVHALDFDDTHAEGVVHATTVVLPTVSAVAQETGATGEEALIAAVIGYETICRLGAASSYGFHARGLHATKICGPLASAAAAARLMGLDPDTTVNALGIAGSTSGGLLEFLATGASTKQLHPGLAAMEGILAARLAAAGATGPDSVIEGAQGLLRAFSAREVHPDRVLRDLGSSWEVERITIKPYPCCHFIHAALDATHELVDKFDVGEVSELVVEIHPDSAAIVAEPDAVKKNPRTPYDAKFSLQWSVAAMLVDGEVGIDTYDPDRLDRPDVHALADRVTVHTVPSETPATGAPARVVARLSDGRELDASVPCSAGGPQRPLSDTALTQKLRSASGADPAAVVELAATVFRLEDLSSLKPLLDAVERVRVDRIVGAGHGSS